MKALIVSENLGFLHLVSGLVEAKQATYRIATGQSSTQMVLQEDQSINVAIIDAQSGITPSIADTISTAVSRLIQRDGKTFVVVKGGEDNSFPATRIQPTFFLTSVLDTRLLEALG